MNNCGVFFFNCSLFIVNYSLIRGTCNMKINEASSEVFWRALKELPKKERESVIRRMVKDREVMKEMFDIIVRQCREN